MQVFTDFKAASYWSTDTSEESIIAVINRVIEEQTAGVLTPLLTAKAVKSRFLTVVTTGRTINEQPEITLIHTQVKIADRRSKTVDIATGEKTITVMPCNELFPYTNYFMDMPQPILDLFCDEQYMPRNEPWLDKIYNLEGARQLYNALPRGTLLLENDEGRKSFLLASGKGKARRIHERFCAESKPMYGFIDTTLVETEPPLRVRASRKQFVHTTGHVFNETVDTFIGGTDRKRAGGAGLSRGQGSESCIRGSTS